MENTKFFAILIINDALQFVTETEYKNFMSANAHNLDFVNFKSYAVSTFTVLTAYEIFSLLNLELASQIFEVIEASDPQPEEPVFNDFYRAVKEADNTEYDSIFG